LAEGEAKRMIKLGFGTIDLIAFIFFICCWLTYHYLVESTRLGRTSLHTLMNDYRQRWMQEMFPRDNRIVDTTISASLQNGTAFFASTSLVALGATLSLLRSTNEFISIFHDIPFAEVPTKAGWELKIIGLAVIFAYAFFKFAWSYRLFNYCSILIGATPQPESHNVKEVKRALHRAAAMNIVAGRHFNRGQRAFFFALAYLGWFISPWVFIITTGASLYAMWHRQFASDALACLQNSDDSL
jgi:uncharacterized membrane protein